jgi:hypothetical protein
MNGQDMYSQDTKAGRKHRQAVQTTRQHLKAGCSTQQCERKRVARLTHAGTNRKQERLPDWPKAGIKAFWTQPLRATDWQDTLTGTRNRGWDTHTSSKQTNKTQDRTPRQAGHGD